MKVLIYNVIKRPFQMDQTRLIQCLETHSFLYEGFWKRAQSDTLWHKIAYTECLNFTYLFTPKVHRKSSSISSSNHNLTPLDIVAFFFVWGTLEWRETKMWERWHVPYRGRSGEKIEIKVDAKWSRRSKWGSGNNSQHELHQTTYHNQYTPTLLRLHIKVLQLFSY